MCGWLVAIIICVVKGVSIWKGGIGNNQMSKSGDKYWLVYGFY